MLWDILCKHSEENHALNTDEIIAFLAEKNIAVLLQDIALLNEYGYWKHFSGVFIIKSAIIICDNFHNISVVMDCFFH